MFGNLDIPYHHISPPWGCLLPRHHWRPEKVSIFWIPVSIPLTSPSCKLRSSFTAASLEESSERKLSKSPRSGTKLSTVSGPWKKWNKVAVMLCFDWKDLPRRWLCANRRSSRGDGGRHWGGRGRCRELRRVVWRLVRVWYVRNRGRRSNLYSEIWSDMICTACRGTVREYLNSVWRLSGNDGRGWRWCNLLLEQFQFNHKFKLNTCSAIALRMAVLESEKIW